jgi:IS5 family transposase
MRLWELQDLTRESCIFRRGADSRLLERCRELLVKAAARYGLKPRQNYNREAPRLGLQIGRYAHAKQYKRIRKSALKQFVSRCTGVTPSRRRQCSS